MGPSSSTRALLTEDPVEYVNVLMAVSSGIPIALTTTKIIESRVNEGSGCYLKTGIKPELTQVQGSNEIGMPMTHTRPNASTSLSSFPSLFLRGSVEMKGE